MTAVSARPTLKKTHKEIDFRKERIFPSPQSLRKPNLELIEDAFSFSQDEPLQGKVIDLISIYKAVLDMRCDISPSKIFACDKFLDEIESCLNHFLDHKILPDRKRKISEILDPQWSY